MPHPRLRLQSAGAERLDLDFGAVRTELNVPAEFPPAVVEAAAAAAAEGPHGDHVDRTDVELITVDPPGAMDLDQALHLAPRRGGGIVVHYAIADLAAYIRPGDAVDVEARRRGTTLYSPDLRTPLHPPILSEGAVSLLPGKDRPALLWRIELDSDGYQIEVDVRRSIVRSRERLDYAGLQQMLDAGTAPEAARLLPELGRLRGQIGAERGAVELGLPEQEVQTDAEGHWHLVRRGPLTVEGWNAQVSLLTGMAAAGLMLDGGVGLLRTLPPADARTVEQLRHAARALDIDWPPSLGPAELIRGLTPQLPAHAALLEEAAQLLRGAGYTPFDGTLPESPSHAGVGAPYAHVTAPIRRLCDRFASEICVSISQGTEVPSWVTDSLEEIPDLMAAATTRSRALERATVDLTEAWLLADRVGEVFDAAVVELRDNGATVALDDPPVRARCSGQPPLGERISVRLTEADIATRSVRFEPA